MTCRSTTRAPVSGRRQHIGHVALLQLPAGRPAAFASCPAVECPGVQEGVHDGLLPAVRPARVIPPAQRALGKGEARLQRQRHLIRLIRLATAQAGCCGSARALASAGGVRAWPRRWAGLPTRSSVSACSSVPILRTISDERTCPARLRPRNAIEPHVSGEVAKLMSPRSVESVRKQLVPRWQVECLSLTALRPG